MGAYWAKFLTLNKVLGPKLAFLEPWLPWIIGGLVLLLVAGIAIFFWWRTRNQASNGPDTVAIKLPNIPQMGGSRLSGVFDGFISRIPWLLRRSVLGYPLFLVLGESGSGKTTLIDQNARWQGQSYRFHPSHTEDPLLQIYLGARSLVLEFSSTLLYETSPGSYRAMRRLWKKLPTSPTPVLVIDVGQFIHPQPDRLRQSAQALFGKLEFFSELQPEPLRLILALTHCDQIRGYSAFCLFVEEIGQVTRLDFGPEGRDSTAGGFDYMQRHISRALVNRSTSEFMQILDFFSHIVPVLDTLDDFLRIAREMGTPGSESIMRLCLLSEQVHTPGANPFLPLETPVKLPLWDFDEHARTALVMAGLGIAYLVSGYTLERSELDEVVEHGRHVGNLPIELYADEISPLFRHFTHGEHQTPLLSFAPNYFEELENRHRIELIRLIRKNYLLPIMMQLEYDPEGEIKINGLLGLLFATSDNEMGQLILEHVHRWSELFKIPEVLIRDYISHNTETTEILPYLNTFSSKTSTSNTLVDHTQWHIYFSDLEQLTAKSYITDSEIQHLHKKTDELLEVINRIETYKFQDQLIKWLTVHTPYKQTQIKIYDDFIQLRQEGIRKLLELMRSLQTGKPDEGVQLTLSQCLEQVLALSKLESLAKPEEDDIVFSLDGHAFKFNAATFRQLMNRSRMTLLLRNFMQAHNQNDGWVFFDPDKTLADLEMNAGNEGAILFAGKGRVDGRLTRVAFDQYVKPGLLSLTDNIEKLPIASEEKLRFEDFLVRNLLIYADRYASAYTSYFRQLDIRVDSAWSLKFILQQLQTPDSPLLQTLLSIKENTQLDVPTGIHFQAIREKLAVFKFIQRLMADQNGVYQEFGKYQLLMLQMQAELDNTGTATDMGIKKDEMPGAGLKSALSPLGRVSLGVLLNEDTSYLRLVSTWLQNAGITDFWQKPFLAPVLGVRDLGRVEITQSVQGIWKDIWVSNVQGLLPRFPINRMGDKDSELTPSDLIKVLHPKEGSFWMPFNRYLAGLFRYANGKWAKREELMDVLNLPSLMLNHLNIIQNVTSTLWDETGNPKALQFMVRSELLPKAQTGQGSGVVKPSWLASVFASSPPPQLASLAYLRCGNSSLIGFNQQPAWQKFSVEWWNNPPASVGLEFREEDPASRTHADLVVSDSSWNFLRLIMQADQSNTGYQYRWHLYHPVWPDQHFAMIFSFQTSPYEPFQMAAGIKPWQ